MLSSNPSNEPAHSVNTAETGASGSAVPSSAPTTPSDALVPEPGTPSRPVKSAGRSLVEDLAVTACGTATSAAVAYGSFAMAKYWNFAVYTWMANLVIPVGAILCGFVAATGYWWGARWFHHRPTRLLLASIVVVSLSTFFWIHQLNYSHVNVDGVPLADHMSFSDYMVAVTENMSYRRAASGGDGLPLGKWGWGVAALQVLGFCLGGFAVYGMLVSVPYCERCSMYFNKVWGRVSKWKDVEAMTAAYEAVARLLDTGHLQAAVDQHAALERERKSGGLGLLTLELRKCPNCENRRLKLLAQKRVSNKVIKLAEQIVPTQESISKAA